MHLRTTMNMVALHSGVVRKPVEVFGSKCIFGRESGDRIVCLLVA